MAWERGTDGKAWDRGLMERTGWSRGMNGWMGKRTSLTDRWGVESGRERHEETGLDGTGLELMTRVRTRLT